ncbi:MAG: hypothetical protein ACJ8H8_09140 [Geminicoccaceae bacterium]
MRSVDPWRRRMGWRPGDAVPRLAMQAFATFWFAVGAWMILNQDRIQAQLAQQLAEEIEAESSAACGRLGMPQGSAAYAACAAELAAVRQRQENRQLGLAGLP